MPKATKNATPEERKSAGRSLAYAVKTGRIHKPSVCEICRKEVGIENIQGHHFDYDDPYDVKWLCRSCHKGLHRQLRELDRLEKESIVY